MVEQPPKVEFGEYALPLSFELAKKATQGAAQDRRGNRHRHRADRRLRRLEVAGAGYINARLKRSRRRRARQGRCPHSAAHREGEDSRRAQPASIPTRPRTSATCATPSSATLSFACCAPAATGRRAELHRQHRRPGCRRGRRLPRAGKEEQGRRRAAHQVKPRFDYLCWDVYARVSQWYEQDKANLKKRAETLHAIEQGNNEIAEMAEIISTAVLRRHLETMERLYIEYDFLPRESEILRLHFWDLAFKQMKDKGVLYNEEHGKNAGCWVMRASVTRQGRAEAEHTDEDQKVIVRSNGTVGYVGKDIAYHLWKFGLLGRDFDYRRFYQYPNQKEVWISADEGEKEHPHFGEVERHLQRDRHAPGGSAEHRDRRATRARLHRCRRALHALLLRNGGAHAALRARTRLSADRRRDGARRTSRCRAARDSASRPTT